MYDNELDLMYEVVTIDMFWIRMIEDAVGDIFIGVL